MTSRPTWAPGGPGLAGGLAALAGPLFLLVVLTNPALFGFFLFWFVVLAALVWLLGRVGMLGVLLFAAGRRRHRPDRQVPVLSLRCTGAGRPRQVVLRGHDSGVELGDHIVARGVNVGGTLHATSLVNHSTGVVLRREGLVRLMAFAALDTWLLFALLAQVGGS